MRNDNHGPPLSDVVKRFLHDPLGLGVEGRGGLIQKQDLGVGDDAASDDNALLLATREGCTALSNDGFITLGKVLDKVVGEGCLTRLLD